MVKSSVTWRRESKMALQRPKARAEPPYICRRQVMLALNGESFQEWKYPFHIITER